MNRRVLPPAPHRRFDDGQFDGDRPRSAGFQGQFKPGAGPNALGAAMPPWHMWGNTLQIDTAVQSPTNPITFATGQLVRIAYKRPETWHWVFAVKLIDGPDADAVDGISLRVFFDLTIGIGRSMVQIPASGVFNNQNNDRSFDAFELAWGGPTVGIQTTFPRNAQLYGTATQSYKQVLAGLAPTATTPTALVDQIVAQDIQLNCRVLAITTPGSPFIGGVVRAEVSAHFAPKTHVRPDWFREGPEPAQYQGGEVEGR